MQRVDVARTVRHLQRRFSLAEGFARVRYLGEMAPAVLQVRLHVGLEGYAGLEDLDEEVALLHRQPLDLCRQLAHRR